MLELLLVWKLSTRLGEIAESNGQSSALGWLAAGGWFGGEILGFAMGFTLFGDAIAAYLAALVCAGLGAAAAWFLVSRMQPAVSVSGFPPSQTAAAPAPYAPPVPASMPQPSAPYAPTPPPPMAAGPQPYSPPAAPAAAATSGSSAAPAVQRAAYCSGCDSIVLLREDGSCSHGHPAAMIGRKSAN